jgi:hypothetical protein
MSLDTDEFYDQVRLLLRLSVLSLRLRARYRQDQLSIAFKRMAEGDYHTAVCKSVEVALT